ncbi:flavodoxin reductase [Flavihumibacter sp. ZG627]|uniref:flavodoxin reductase n=1 Tax=Flavihumibacter sp. ZG627 TaxID=1463156 RepID=UPI00057DE48A|nr:flavodoxin reductase [Flavihumibacter sp. ZG627]KIC89348.1 flavodoxin reductase [Flavihumibacter sp. ZG627]
MAHHIVKVLQANYINHDVKRFIVEKPAGYFFQPGQGCYVAINHPDWKDKFRPFTFTSLGDWPYLEFTIKIYEEHRGVTNELGKINADAELIIQDAFGVLQYKGPGVFIAGGTGITPFISIFRALRTMNLMTNNMLVWSNKTSDDLFLEKELEEMLGDDFIRIFTREGVIGFMERRIDKKKLIDIIQDFGRHFYVCGPKDFVSQISAHLVSLGARADYIVIDQK